MQVEFTRRRLRMSSSFGFGGFGGFADSQDSASETPRSQRMSQTPSQGATRRTKGRVVPTTTAATLRAARHPQELLYEAVAGTHAVLVGLLQGECGYAQGNFFGEISDSTGTVAVKQYLDAEATREEERRRRRRRRKRKRKRQEEGKTSLRWPRPAGPPRPPPPPPSARSRSLLRKRKATAATLSRVSTPRRQVPTRPGSLLRASTSTRARSRRCPWEAQPGQRATSCCCCSRRF